MTRTVIALFPDADAARRAAVALGRTELAAGPTRLQGTAGGGRGARLAARVEPADTPRAVALLRQHGAAVADRDDDHEAPVDPADTDDPGRDTASPLAGWGMAVADAVTAAMAGATASDAQLPDKADAAAPAAGPAPQERKPARAREKGREQPAHTHAGPTPETPAAQPIWGNAPNRSAAGSGSGANLSHTMAAGTGSHMGQVGPGTSIQAAMGATDETGTARGTWTRADPAEQQRADDVPMRDPRPRGARPKSDA
jgi:hypothetical protein